MSRRLYGPETRTYGGEQGRGGEIFWREMALERNRDLDTKINMDIRIGTLHISHLYVEADVSEM